MSGELWLFVAVVFGSVALLTGSMASLVLSNGAPVRRRLHDLTRSDNERTLVTAESLTPTLSPVMARFARFVPKSPEQLGKLRLRLVRAGHHGLTPVVVYRLSELAVPVLTMAIVFVSVPKNAALIALLAGLIGYRLPRIVLQRLTARRQKVIRNGLPDALDLFVVCLEAGSSLDQAILLASTELSTPYPALAEEFTMMTTEIRAGKPRPEAFRNFSERTGVDDVRALTGMLIQTDRFGTSLAQALRAHAETARTKRRQRAEERAAKVGVKLVFPLVFCLFPGFFVIAVGPAVIQFLRIFIEQVAGQ